MNELILYLFFFQIKQIKKKSFEAFFNKKEKRRTYEDEFSISKPVQSYLERLTLKRTLHFCFPSSWCSNLHSKICERVFMDNKWKISSC